MRSILKILHITPILGPANGGSATVPLDLAKQQAKRGHDVTIITSNYKYNDQTIDSANGISIICFDCAKWFPIAFYTPDMRNWLKRRIADYDIVHLHNLRSYQSIITYRYATKNIVPYVVQAHGSAPIMEGKETLKKLFDLVWTKRLLRQSSGCIAVSNIEVMQYARLGVDPSIVNTIPNALDVANYHSLPEKSLMMERNGFSPECKVILYLGRLNRRKGIDVLIRAFIRLNRERKETALLICGPDDGYENHLRNIVKGEGMGNEVRFLGFVDDPVPFYSCADVLVYPSRNEIFGLVPFEAIMSGTPIIVSNDSGCGEIVTEANCGITVPNDDEISIYRSICFLLDHPIEAREMVSKGRKYVEERLSWETVVSQFEKAYINAMMVTNPEKSYR